MNNMNFTKYHALGNDYIVINPKDISNDRMDIEQIKRICHRNFGVGSDGILLGPLNSTKCDFRLLIYNPDGSEAEKSGNGLRMFARYLWDKSLVDVAPFTVETLGGNVSCEIRANGKSVKVEMGKVSFNSSDIPVVGPSREVLNEEIEIDGKLLRFCAATVGNPHCVVLTESPTFEMAHHWGPLIESNLQFPNKINVQFMKIIDRHNIQIEIWERGAGYTLASGSSSTAAAAVAIKLGLCDSDITVQMPGGQIELQFGSDFSAIMTGPVTKVFDGMIKNEMFEWIF
jgi:diaminopimelate epimerase